MWIGATVENEVENGARVMSPFLFSIGLAKPNEPLL